MKRKDIIGKYCFFECCNKKRKGKITRFIDDETVVIIDADKDYAKPKKRPLVEITLIKEEGKKKWLKKQSKS